MSYEHINCDLDGSIMTVTLNRPDKLNAYTGQMGAEIADAFERADGDDNVRAIIVTGAGRALLRRAPTFRAARRVLTRPASMVPASSPLRNKAAAALSRRSSTAANRRSRRSMDRRWASASP